MAGTGNGVRCAEVNQIESWHSAKCFKVTNCKRLRGRERGLSMRRRKERVRQAHAEKKTIGRMLRQMLGEMGQYPFFTIVLNTVSCR